MQNLFVCFSLQGNRIKMGCTWVLVQMIIDEVPKDILSSSHFF